MPECDDRGESWPQTSPDPVTLMTHGQAFLLTPSSASPFEGVPTDVSSSNPTSYIVTTKSADLPRGGWTQERGLQALEAGSGPLGKELLGPVPPGSRKKQEPGGHLRSAPRVLTPGGREIPEESQSGAHVNWQPSRFTLFSGLRAALQFQGSSSCVMCPPPPGGHPHPHPYPHHTQTGRAQSFFFF